MPNTSLSLLLRTKIPTHVTTSEQPQLLSTGMNNDTFVLSDCRIDQYCDEKPVIKFSYVKYYSLSPVH